MGRIRSKEGASLAKGLGLLGESWAKAYLAGKGYRILETGFRCALGEIDLVAEEAGELVFIEVKTRKDTSFGYPEEQLPFSKRKRLGRLAQVYLKQHERKERPARFDVVSILMTKEGRVIGADLIQNAFSP